MPNSYSYRVHFVPFDCCFTYVAQPAESPPQERTKLRKRYPLVLEKTFCIARLALAPLMCWRREVSTWLDARSGLQFRMWEYVQATTCSSCGHATQEQSKNCAVATGRERETLQISPPIERNGSSEWTTAKRATPWLFSSGKDKKSERIDRSWRVILWTCSWDLQ